jgi:Tol biopolymer transport system component
MPDDLLGSYEIIGPLGAGGMGEVYRARDTRLNRQVAIKILPPGYAEDSERLSRFQREARVLASLNHSNIAAIYGFEEANDQKFFILELVEGKTLAQLLEKGSLPSKKAVRYAVEIARGLEAAHEKGVIHRDLKPANVMITPDDRVKVLDFGLAKAIDESTEPLDLTHSPTLIDEKTKEGRILGTAPYMSPEQVEGIPLDPRTDIFSFGSLLYEMIAGRKAFPGKTQARVLAGILEKEPKPLGRRLRGVPQQLEWVVARCLRKDPERRFQHMRDLRLALEDVLQELQSPRRWRRRVSSLNLWQLAVAGLALAAVLFGGLWWGTAGDPARLMRPPVLTRVTSVSGLTVDPAISRRGRLLGYASDRSGEGNLDIWVQQLGGGGFRRTRDPADDHQPSFHPDGTRMVFRSERRGGGLYWTTTLADEAGARFIVERGRRPRVSPQGDRIAYWTGRVGAGFRRGSLFTIGWSSSRARTQLAESFAIASHPIWSPRGDHIVFLGWESSTRDEDFDWWILRLEDGDIRRLGLAARLPQAGISGLVIPGVWVPIDNFIVFSARRGDSVNLWRVAISPRTMSLEGEPRQITSGVGPELEPYAVLPGRIAFSSQIENLDLWSLAIDADRGRVPEGARLQRLTQHAGEDSHPSLSADGSLMAFESTRSGNRDIWLMELESGTKTNLTESPGEERRPRIRTDGIQVAYSSGESDSEERGIYRVEARRQTLRTSVCQDCGLPLDWSSQGDEILVVDRIRGGERFRVDLLDVTSGRRLKLLEHPQHSVVQAKLDPADRWVAFTVVEDPLQARIYVAPFRQEEFHESSGIAPERWVAVTDGQDRDGMTGWSPNGKLLYFVSNRGGARGIWVQELDPKDRRPVGDPRLVWHFRETRLSLAGVSPSSLRTNVARDKLVFTLKERMGDIWMAHFPLEEERLIRPPWRPGEERILDLYPYRRR